MTMNIEYLKKIADLADQAESRLNAEKIFSSQHLKAMDLQRLYQRAVNYQGTDADTATSREFQYIADELRKKLGDNPTVTGIAKLLGRTKDLAVVAEMIEPITIDSFWQDKVTKPMRRKRKAIKSLDPKSVIQRGVIEELATLVDEAKSLPDNHFATLARNALQMQPSSPEDAARKALLARLFVSLSFITDTTLTDDQTALERLQVIKKQLGLSNARDLLDSEVRLIDLSRVINRYRDIPTILVELRKLRLADRTELVKLVRGYLGKVRR